MQVSLNIPQTEFLSIPAKFRAFVAGFGSGKTFVGCASQCIHYLEHPKVNQGYFAPTYPLRRDIFYPTADEVAHMFGMKTKAKLGDKEVDYYVGSQYRGTTICRTMDNPANIVGFKVGRALVDEDLQHAIADPFLPARESQSLIIIDGVLQEAPVQKVRIMRTPVLLAAHRPVAECCKIAVKAVNVDHPDVRRAVEHCLMQGPHGNVCYGAKRLQGFGLTSNAQVCGKVDDTGGNGQRSKS